MVAPPQTLGILREPQLIELVCTGERCYSVCTGERCYGVCTWVSIIWMISIKHDDYLIIVDPAVSRSTSINQWLLLEHKQLVGF
jgi:hypothetical protein